jgi:hypothetical protein
MKAAPPTKIYGGKKSMKNKLSSNMDTSKKKTSIIIACMMLFAVTAVRSLLVVQAQGSTSEMQATPYASYYVAECQGCCNGWYEVRCFFEAMMESYLQVQNKSNNIYFLDWDWDCVSVEKYYFDWDGLTIMRSNVNNLGR